MYTASCICFPVIVTAYWKLRWVQHWHFCFLWQVQSLTISCESLADILCLISKTGLQLHPACGSRAVSAELKIIAKLDECVSFGRKTFEFSERLEGRREGRRKRWREAANHKLDKSASVQTRCSSETLTPRQTWMGGPRFPSRHGHVQCSGNTGRLSGNT